jgi:hypothetical protein
MGVHHNGSAMKINRLRRGSLGLCLVTGVCVLALTARLQERKTYAQTSPLPSTSTGQLGISPEEPVAPPQPIVMPVPAQGAANSAGPGQPAKVEMPAIPEPDPKNPVAVQSAALLKLAYNLKSEVDKTTKDTLSVTVVRQATEIEQMARKMRTK